MTYHIQRAAVIGAGTMGAGIAAHLANVGIPAYLLDIAPRELTDAEKAKGLTLSDPAVRNRIVNEGMERLKKSRPAALYLPEFIERITPGNLEDNFEWVGEADWIIEAVVENLAIKQDLMAWVEAVRKPGSVVSTNTSSLPIYRIAEGRSDDFRAHFLGTHFFNPPRYLKLLEIIPAPDTDPAQVEYMVRFGEEALGKGVVVCKDTPNFIANRFISFDTMYTIQRAIENGYTVEEVDNLTGRILGRPKSGTLRLADLVGLDVAERVNTNLYDAIPGDEDREILRGEEKTRAVLSRMLAENKLGEKTGEGFYKKIKADGQSVILALDFVTFAYQPSAKVRFDSVGAVRDLPLPARLRALVESDDRAGRFICAITDFGLAYAAKRVPEIADSPAAIDDAVRWGFAREFGPFETWDALGVRETVARMEREGLRVAPWVKAMIADGNTTFYRRDKAGRKQVYDPATSTYLPVRERPGVLSIDDLKAARCELESNPDASLIDMGDGVLLLEFHSKLNTLTPGVFALWEAALARLRGDPAFVGMVIGNEGEDFCTGANLMVEGGVDIDALVRRMQNLAMCTRYSPKPVVVAPHGRVLGGGAEIVLAGARVVAAAETYIGLVEAGVGLVPAGGGCKEMVRRLVSPAAMVDGVDALPFLAKVFETIGLAKVAESAHQARQMGFLAASDRIVVNSDTRLYEAKRAALALAPGYCPPGRGKLIYALGERGIATMNAMVYGMVQGGWASEHDALVADKLAHVLCGGPLSAPQWVDEQYILDLEREAFLALLTESKTQERIFSLLQTGRPVRN